MNVMVENQADHAISDEYAKYRADVTRTAYNDLASAGIDFAARDVDTFYNRAWHGVFSRLWAKGDVGNLERLVADSTYRQAVDEHRVLHPETRMDVEVLEAVGIADPIEGSPEQQQLQREFSARMRKRLTQRELQAVTLCHVYGFKAFEAADLVDVGAFRLAELMDDVIEEFEPLLEGHGEGEACEELLPLMNQYALGILDPRSDEYRTASSHIADCAGCTRHAIEARGLTAVTNPTGTMLRALTGSLSLGVAESPVAARRAPSPLREKSAKKQRASDARAAEDRRRKGLIVGAVAATVVAGILLVGQLGGGEDASVKTAQSSESAAAERADAKAAKERREARERRADRRAERRREARARSRARARARAKAAAARRAARANAGAATPQVQQQAPQSAPQVQQPAPTRTAPAPAPAPKPSTDPSQEFDVP